MSKVVVFDVDGTLFDTKPGIIKAINDVLNGFGMGCINATDEDKWIGPPIRDSFKKISGMSNEQAEEATKRYRRIYTEIYISESFLYEGMENVLNRLKSDGAHLCIATMKTKEQMDRLLSLKNMINVFEVVETAALDGSKSKVEMLDMIKNKFINSKYFYMVGDTVSDLEAANKAGFSFIEVDYGYGLKKDFCYCATDILKYIFDENIWCVK